MEDDTQAATMNRHHSKNDVKDIYKWPAILLAETEIDYTQA